MKLSESDIQESKEQLAAFLSHAFPAITIEHVTSDAIQRPDAAELRDTYQAYYRMVIPAETKQDIIETRGDVRSVLRSQLQQMERNRPAPDTRIIATHHPPQHIKKPLVFYGLATL